MGSVAADDVTQIKEGEELVEKANKKLNALKQKVRQGFASRAYKPILFLFLFLFLLFTIEPLFLFLLFTIEP